MGRVEVPRCDIGGMDYYKIPRDVFEAAYRDARNRTAAAKRLAAVVEYAFTGNAELLQSCNDSAAFLSHFCSRIDRSRSNAFAALQKSEKKRLTAETQRGIPCDLSRCEPSDLRTDKRLENRDKREELTITSVSGETDAIPPSHERANSPPMTAQAHAKPRRRGPYEAVTLSENPPTAEQIVNYGRSKGFEAFTGERAYEEARALIDYNEGIGWKAPDGTPFTDYRGLVRLWNDRAEEFGAY